MAKRLAEMPAVDFTEADFRATGLPVAQARAAQAHGPIYRWPIRRGEEAGTEVVFMTGPEANRFVLHTHRDHFSHDLGWTPVIGPDFGHGLLNMDDPEHARHRKMWNPAFTSAYMEAYLPVIQRIVDERTRAWPERAEVNLLDEAREITFEAAAAALAGFPRGAAVDRLRGLFYTMLHGWDESAESDTTFFERWQSARDELVTMLLVLIAERRVAPPEQQPRDVLGMIVRARDEDGAALTDVQVLAHLNILLIAGHETTTTLGAWVLYLLAAMPEQRARIEQELDALGVAPEAPLSVEAVRGMKLLDAFIREAGRLYSPVLNVPRGVVKDFEFGGYWVPAGTRVRLALAAGHRLPEVFADPERFDPDRFLPPREEDKRRPYSLVTFGGGPRICIGINFANIEVKALAAHALRRFQLRPLPDQQPLHTGFWTADPLAGINVTVSRL